VARGVRDLEERNEGNMPMIISIVRYETHDTRKESLGRISFTADIWSDILLRPYLAITAHWIAKKNGFLRLRSALIAFHYLPGSHDGKAICTAVIEMLERADVLTNVSISIIAGNVILNHIKLE
jgi:hypothetical protein